MNRQEVKQMLPILQAFAEGKTILRWNDNTVSWEETESIGDDINANSYTIKPSPKYRPFANAEECWNEMLKHQPFGWVKDKDDGHYVFISYIDTRDGICFSRSGNWSFADVDKYYIFADGSVFGIEES